jgi:hypothetical protein
MGKVTMLEYNPCLEAAARHHMPWRGATHWNAVRRAQMRTSHVRSCHGMMHAVLGKRRRRNEKRAAGNQRREEGYSEFVAHDFSSR